MKKLSILFLSLCLATGTYSCKDAENGNDMEDHDSSSHNHDDDSMEDHDHKNGEGHSGMSDNKNGMNKGNMKNMSFTVQMSSKSGSDVNGEIKLEQRGETVMMTADLNGLSEGKHAIHIHENGDCSSDDGKSAGGHWNPTNENHGKWGQDVYHHGDIGNMTANSEGEVTYKFSTDKWCLGCDDMSKNIMGKAFIVHKKADDFTSQPSGAAGARVACGVIKK